MLIPVNVDQELLKKLARARNVSLDSEEVYRQLIEQAIHDALQVMVVGGREAQDDCPYDHTPNEETAQTLADSAAGKDVIHCKNLEEMWDKLGI